MRCTVTTFPPPPAPPARGRRHRRPAAKRRTSHEPVPSAGRWREARSPRAPFAEPATVRIVQMNLLFDDIDVIETAGDPAAVDVRGIAHDSRRVVPGDLFCCVPGLLSDGHAYAAEAVDRGAVGLLCEHLILELLDQPVVQTLVAPGTIRPVMARLAAAFYGNPARDLLMIGVTGTNGKTTVTQLLGELLSAAGRPTKVMG